MQWQLDKFEYKAKKFPTGGLVGEHRSRRCLAVITDPRFSQLCFNWYSAIYTVGQVVLLESSAQKWGNSLLGTKRGVIVEEICKFFLTPPCILNFIEILNKILCKKLKSLKKCK